MTAVRDALRIYRCWQCKRTETVTPEHAVWMYRPWDCECGGFMALWKLASAVPPEAAQPNVVTLTREEVGQAIDGVSMLVTSEDREYAPLLKKLQDAWSVVPPAAAEPLEPPCARCGHAYEDHHLAHVRLDRRWMCSHNDCPCGDYLTPGDRVRISSAMPDAAVPPEAPKGEQGDDRG